MNDTITKTQFMIAKKKKDDIKLALAKFEAKDKTYALWCKWENMNPNDQAALLARWDRYYLDAREGYYGKLFSKARKAFSAGDIDQVKLYSEEARTATVPEIPKPSTVDPRDLRRYLDHYFALVERQQEYQRIYDYWAPMYEKRSTDDSL